MMLMYDTGQTIGMVAAMCLLLVILGILWSAAFAMCHWFTGPRSGNAGGAGRNARKGFVVALLGTALVACWMVGGIHLPHRDDWWEVVHSITRDDSVGWVARWIVVALALGLLPVCAFGVVELLLPLFESAARPLRPVAGKCLLLAVAVAVCLWVVGVIDGVPLAVMVAVGFAAMIFLALLGSGRSTPAAAADIASERDRVMRLLEEGKISAHESAEILVALAQSAPDQGGSEPLSAGRKLMIAGALVALVGFLLPWFQVNITAELTRVMGWDTASPVQRQLGLLPEAGMPFGQGTSGAGITIRGGDVGNGLGWIALALPLLAAVLPHIAPKLPAGNMRTATLLALAAGSIITLHVLSSGWRSATYGIGIFAAGYVILWVGAAIDRRGSVAVASAVPVA